MRFSKWLFLFLPVEKKRNLKFLLCSRYILYIPSMYHSIYAQLNHDATTGLAGARYACASCPLCVSAQPRLSRSGYPPTPAYSILLPYACEAGAGPAAVELLRLGGGISLITALMSSAYSPSSSVPSQRSCYCCCCSSYSAYWLPTRKIET